MKRICLSSVLVLAGVPASADPIFDTFGPFPNATFGGTGIPNDSVAASTQIVDGDNLITVALSSTQRFNLPAVIPDPLQDGVYIAQPGVDDIGGTQLLGSEWNFNFYVEVRSISGANDPSITDYNFDLLYDFDAGVDTPFSSLGRIDYDIAAPAATISTFEDFADGEIAQGSQNLLFGFLGTSFSVDGFGTPVPPGTPGSIPVIEAPSATYDPFAAGEYSFAIGVSTVGGFPLESVAIDVVVVPEPGVATLAGLGALGLMARRRRTA
ncbi:MAG: PEP-CTERM sorting domain-containing protein [Planctomycetota bacterium]